MDDIKYQQIAAQLRKPTGEEGIKTGQVMNKGNLLMNTKTLEVLNPSANDSILEIGMGNGYFVKDILANDPSIKYTGCDYSEEMIAESVEMNLEQVNAGRAEFMLSSADEMPFPDGQFNKLFTVNTIYFWEDRKKTLAEFRRVLQPGGTLIISFRPKHQMMQYPFTRYGFNMFSKEDVIKLLEENGFTITAIHNNQEPDFLMEDMIIKLEHMIVVAMREK